MSDLICISHLRWDFVWQRPQHLLSRLAQQHRILFVEEPMTCLEVTKPRLEIFPARGCSKKQQVNIVRLLQPAEEHCWIGHNDARTQRTYERLLRDYLNAEGWTDPILWLYVSMAMPFARVIKPKLLIYDVMDELSAFKGAPSELKKYDQILLRQADIVFTGGASLYRSKSAYNPNAHLFPSGVEIEHFAQAAHVNGHCPDDLLNVPHPILGYFGVIDERMDLPLLAHLAEAHPDWSLVMIGPVIKIDPAELPQAPNLHYLGMKEYQQLPGYLAHFDVALVPFAMNEATRYLSPTKTLEYLAAHKPVVSTPLHDIVELYGDYVRVGRTPAEFMAQVENTLAETDNQRAIRRTREEQLLAQHTWDNIAQEMGRIIRTQLTRTTRAAKQPYQRVPARTA
jgi:UDP-galactopyranose mutase